MISSRLFSNKDFKLYEEILLEYSSFNSLNEDFLGIYNRSSLFNKIQYKAGARLLFNDETPIVFIWSETRNEESKIRTIIPFKEFYNLSYKDLKDIMPTFVSSLPIYLDIAKFEYLMNGKSENEKLLAIMGYNLDQGVLRMEMNLQEIEEFNEKIQVKIFKVEDLKRRVDIQNKIFHSKYRIPINATDILLEISKKNYLPKLSFFCIYNGEYIGFGQISKYKKMYFLVNFGLVPEYRQMGLSKPFLHQIINATKREGAETLYLDVSSKNEQAVRLYRGVGFKAYDNTFTWVYEVGDGVSFKDKNME